MFVIVEVDLVAAGTPIIGYWQSALVFNANINLATTLDTRTEARTVLGQALTTSPTREFRYREVTQTLALLP
jgi:hypothetical protein